MQVFFPEILVKALRQRWSGLQRCRNRANMVSEKHNPWVYSLERLLIRGMINYDKYYPKCLRDYELKLARGKWKNFHSHIPLQYWIKCRLGSCPYCKIHGKRQMHRDSIKMQMSFIRWSVPRISIMYAFIETSVFRLCKSDSPLHSREQCKALFTIFNPYPLLGSKYFCIKSHEPIARSEWKRSGSSLLRLSIII